MKKLLLLLVTAMLVIVFFSGCSEKIGNETKIAATKKNEIEFPIDFPENVPEQMMVYDSMMHVFPVEKIKRTIYGNKKIPEMKSEKVKSFGREIDTLTYVGDDGFFSVNFGIYYENLEGKQYDYLFQEEIFQEKKDLKFQKEEKARKDAEDLIETMGLENMKIYKTYYMDADSLAETEIRKTKEDGFWDEVKAGRNLYKGVWREEDACYVFDARIEMDGFPLFELDYMDTDGTMVPGCMLRIFWTKNGVADIQLRAAYDLKETDEFRKLISTDQIEEIIQEKYRGILTEQKISKAEAELIYFPERKSKEVYELWAIPVWKVSYEVQDGENHYVFSEYYDVTDGTEIFAG